MSAKQIELPGYGSVTVDDSTHPAGPRRWFLRSSPHVGSVPCSPFDLVDAVRALLRDAESYPGCADHATLLADALATVGALGALVDHVRILNAAAEPDQRFDAGDLATIASLARKLSTFAVVALNDVEVLDDEQAALWGDTSDESEAAE
ncbi:MAG: hypothetical protein IPJ34_22585 [Myxococcales bacterium]|nr:hypothetical protein [Myxococcales bacterium]